MATLTANLFLDTSGFTSGIDKARRSASNYHQEMSRAAQSISGLEGNIRVLQMQAAGYAGLAASLKTTLNIEAQAQKLSQSGLITKEKALELLRQQEILQRNIANQEKAAAVKQAAADKKAALLSNPRAAGLPEIPLTAEYLKQTERAAFVAQDARNKFNRLAGAMGNSSMGFLAFSQAVEDAQYGIKGVLNNIPQMILGFGGSMGLAGAISLAAVAAVSLYPVIKRLYAAVDNDILKKAADEWGKVFEKGVKAANSALNSTIAAKKLKELTDLTLQNYRQIYSLGQDFASIQRVKIDGLEKEKSILDEIYEVRSKIDLSLGKKTQQQINDEANKKEIEDIQKRVDLLKVEQDYLNDRGSRASTQRSILINEDDEAGNIDAKKLKELKVNLAGAKANLKQAEDEIEQRNETGSKGTLLGNAERNARIARESIEAIKEEIKIHSELSKSASTARSEIIKERENEINSIDERNNKSWQEMKQLESEIRLKKELHEANKKANNIDLKSQQEAYRLEAEMVRARIAGDDKKLADLERQKAIQEEIVALNKLGMTGDKAKDTAAKMVDARKAAEEADKAREDKQKQAGPSAGVSTLGSIAKATNVLMGRAANDGILEESRRQTSVLRTIEKNTQPKTQKPDLQIPVFA